MNGKLMFAISHRTTFFTSVLLHLCGLQFHLSTKIVYVTINLFNKYLLIVTNVKTVEKVKEYMYITNTVMLGWSLKWSLDNIHKEVISETRFKL